MWQFWVVWRREVFSDKRFGVMVQFGRLKEVDKILYKSIGIQHGKRVSRNVWVGYINRNGSNESSCCVFVVIKAIFRG